MTLPPQCTYARRVIRHDGHTLRDTSEASRIKRGSTAGRQRAKPHDRHIQILSDIHTSSCTSGERISIWTHPHRNIFCEMFISQRDIDETTMADAPLFDLSTPIHFLELVRMWGRSAAEWGPTFSFFNASPAQRAPEGKLRSHL